MQPYIDTPIINESIAILGQLLAKLKDEHLALQNGDSSQISALAAEKVKLIAQIELMRVEELLKSLPSDFAETSELIKQLLIDCHNQNLVNGAIIAMSQNFALRALALLRGHPEQVNSCYGSSGKNDQNIAISRSIAKI